MAEQYDKLEYGSESSRRGKYSDNTPMGPLYVAFSWLSSDFSHKMLWYHARGIGSVRSLPFLPDAFLSGAANHGRPLFLCDTASFTVLAFLGQKSQNFVESVESLYAEVEGLVLRFGSECGT